MKRIIVATLSCLVGCSYPTINPIVFNGELKKHLGPEWKLAEGNIGQLQQQRMLMISAEIGEIDFASTLFYDTGIFNTRIYRVSVGPESILKKRSTIIDFVIDKSGKCTQTISPEMDNESSAIYSSRSMWLKERNNELYLAVRKATAEQGIK